jgi:hypothetical protein
MNDDQIEDLYVMDEWVAYGIVILISAISVAAFGFFIGYLL